MNKKAHHEDLLVSQFLVSRTEDLVPEGWCVYELASWLLAAHPNCPVTLIRLGGERIGILVGWVTTGLGDVSRGSLELSPPGEGDPCDLMDYAASKITRLSGRFAALLVCSGRERFYLDSCGSLAALYSLDEEVVLSTASVIGKNEACDDWDSELVERLPYIPFGLSPHRSLKRIVPNHYLDLREWRLTRFWPIAVPEIEPYPGQLESIGDVLRRNVSSLAGGGGWFNLTGGIDSRMVCAFLLGEGRKVSYFTSSDQATDDYLSRRIAGDFDLDHDLLPVEESTDVEIQRRLFISGFCVDKPGLSKVSVRDRRLEQAPFQVSGHGGEILRGYFWKNKDPGRLKIASGSEIVAFMGLEQISRLVSGADAWLESLPDLQPYDLLDLAYLEQRLATWAAPNMYYFDYKSCPTIYAFNVPELMGLLFSTCPHKRRSQRLARDLIRSECRALLNFPINNYGGTRGFRTATKRCVSAWKYSTIRSLGRLRANYGTRRV